MRGMIPPDAMPVRARIPVVLLLLIGLAACQPANVKPTPAPRPAPAPLPTLPPIPEPPAVEDSPATTTKPALPDYPKSAAQISGAAVTSLMKQASKYRAAGEPAKAAGVLERALRIEPRNYFAWSALGQAYLAQKNYAQSMALRSNAIARGNVYAEIENWKTIAAAREARGDRDGAAQAQVQLELRQQRLVPPVIP